MPDKKIPPDAEPDGALDPTEPAGTGETEPAADDEPAPFQNRAARRAHGKQSARPKTSSDRGGVVAGRGSVQGPRQWGNRRSGG